MREEKLALEHVTKQFGQKTNLVTALEDVSLAFKAGEVSLIIGPSGSGKSTLLTILGGLQTPTDGSVRLNGHDISDLSTKEAEKTRLEQIGFVLQAYNLVPYLTVADQFKLVDQVKPNNNLSQDGFDKIIETLGIQKLLNKYPGELSGGQQQRVAIARALYTDPAIILADEPTAALDTARVKEVGQLLANIAHDEEKAVVIVTHDDRLREFSDNVYKIVDGKLSNTD
ncbi:MULTISPECIES: ABC transporter ATP-binding protein [Lactobacillaceae]|uniref:ABC transporter ATP-binding protein n=1 Tax=Lactobacillaceae TaxID=33958 RepID=UPI001C1EDEED|nr:MULTISPECIES: ABC transporter ATP-binding protein [Lactobacillaceae]MBU7449617.1 ABC transporter ATP-binding protein [Lactiplantibacillus sp. 7.2.4]MBU7482008.1 ABC transporter ATP-binding protein [Lactiplantibacillus pentosus]MBU7505032.1 ABC transporter ATP-binding protein [Lactiplantibacillus pentosus]MBU7564555.1 ABC transporter ATP-binding protein [Pediococcus ethanolidurans]MDY1546646.1 ABC transporter ATP-binding protein [Lactiplantibacillus pentosus]